MNGYLVFVSIVFFLTGCVQLRPVNINSDPNLERLERTQEKTELDNIEVFIAEHPELDDDEKRGLREGTTSRSAVLKRHQQTPPKK